MSLLGASLQIFDLDRRTPLMYAYMKKRHLLAAQLLSLSRITAACHAYIPQSRHAYANGNNGPRHQPSSLYCANVPHHHQPEEPPNYEHIFGSEEKLKSRKRFSFLNLCK